MGGLKNMLQAYLEKIKIKLIQVVSYVGWNHQCSLYWGLFYPARWESKYVMFFQSSYEPTRISRTVTHRLLLHATPDTWSFCETNLYESLWPIINSNSMKHTFPGGGFNYLLFSPRKLGKIFTQFDRTYFSDGLVQPPTRFPKDTHQSHGPRDPGSPNVRWWCLGCIPSPKRTREGPLGSMTILRRWARIPKGMAESLTRWWFQIFLIYFPYLGKPSNLTNIH